MSSLKNQRRFRRFAHFQKAYLSKITTASKNTFLSRGFVLVCLYAIPVAIFIGGVALLLLYQFWLKDLSIENIGTQYRERSVIYDRTGEELYSLGGSTRINIGYEDISPNIINGLIAIEDQTFFENRGFDLQGIIRSVIDCIPKGFSGCGGGSTLSQQLVKNVVLTSEQTIERKVKEIYLSFKLNNSLSKEEIITSYLNMMDFGSNAHGVEKATQTFFGKSARDVNILEGAIIASLPKSPTKFSPYRKRERLMGYTYVYETQNPDVQHTNSEGVEHPFEVLNEQFIDYMKGLTFERIDEQTVRICGYVPQYSKTPYPESNGCTSVEVTGLRDFLNGVYMTVLIPGEDSSIEYALEYQAGRKDQVLERMVEDGYITPEEFIGNVRGGLTYNFRNPSESIRAPHFVYYVIDWVEEYLGEGFFDERDGLKVFTSLDPDLQQHAEDLVARQANTNAGKFGATNSSLVSLDNDDGEVLAMVGSRDFFNQDIDGQVNIMTSRKQPGSSFKPLIFARAFEVGKFSPETPIFDVKTDFWGYEPNNYDEKFKGPMTLRTSLAESRNTTAVKMYYMATRESKAANPEHELVEWLQGLGLRNFEKREPAYAYGSAMSLGTGEVRPIEFASAYRTLANNGVYKPLKPVIRIVDKQGNTIDVDELIGKQLQGEQVMLPGAAYLISNILSDNEARPDFWNTYLQLAGGRPAAVKTGTSNKKKGEDILPSDLWTVGYTPQFTTVVWSGNTNGAPSNSKGNGLEASGPIWQNMMNKIHEGVETVSFSRPDDITGANSFLFIKGKEPEIVKRYAVETIEVDGLCVGVVTENTPKSQIEKRAIVRLTYPIESSYEEWVNAIRGYYNSGNASKYLQEQFSLEDGLKAVLTHPSHACERPVSAHPTILTNLDGRKDLTAGVYPLNINYSGGHEVAKADVYVNGLLQDSSNTEITGEGNIYLTIELAASDENALYIVLTDKYGYEYTRSFKIAGGTSATVEPQGIPEEQNENDSSEPQDSSSGNPLQDELNARNNDSSNEDQIENEDTETEVELSDSSEEEVNTDTTNPNILLGTPTHNIKTIDGSMRIVAQATDENLSAASITLNGSIIASSANGSLNTFVNMSSLGAGTHTAIISAIDTSGNTASRSITIEVE